MRRTDYGTNELLLADIRQLVEAKPVLLSDLLKALRGSMYAPSDMELASGRRWTIREFGFQRQLAEAGFFFRYRPHASGNARYIWTKPFDTVTDFHGKIHNVMA